VSTQNVSWFNVIDNFSRNAKLYLAFAGTVGGVIPGGIVLGIWTVLFNLYLLQAGVSFAMIGLMIQLQFLGHGLLVFPFGVLSDAIGRKNTFYLATTLAIISSGLILLTLNPIALLIFSFFLGAGRGAHGVVAGPFMAENSEPRDRTYLFSLSQMISLIFFMIGALVAGFLPGLLALVIGPSASGLDAFRSTLFLTLPFMMLAMLPIHMIKERPRVGIRGFTLKNIKSRKIIGMLLLTQGLYALGFAFIQPLFNVFFVGGYEATTQQVGLIFSIGAAIAAFAAFGTPMLARRLGMVNSVFIGNTVAGLALFMMPFMSVLGPIAGLYFLRQITFSISAPIRQMFSMNIVKPEERGSTEGLQHFVFDVSAAVPPALAGAMMMRNDFFTPFILAIPLQMASSVLYLWYFRDIESNLRLDSTNIVTRRARE